MAPQLQQYLSDVRTGKIDLVAYVQRALHTAHEYDQRYHFFTTICDERALLRSREIQEKIKHRRAGKLAGLLISIKDNICVEGVESTAGSRILKGYKPLFSATVIERLENEDAIVIGKTTQDEFGFGSFNTNVGLDHAVPLHPFDVTRTTGGSSGGAAGITALADFAHIAIAESTGGSIEAPAAFCGVIGFCPTYGKLSRYGLISYADSLDKIGVMSKDVSDIRLVFDVMSGFDEKDGTSLMEKKTQETTKIIKRVGIIRDSFEKTISEETQQILRTMVKALQSQGIEVEEVALPITSRFGVATYYLLSTAEASTNLARFCGLRYGPEEAVKGKTFSDYFTEIRSKHFNEESKRRIILGTFARMTGYRDAYYSKAAKVRTKIIEEYKALFEKYDVLISPTMPMVAPTFDEIKKLTPLQHYMIDILTVGPNLAGIPHATLPIGSTKGLSVGMMAMTNHEDEKNLLQFLEIVEKLVRKKQ